MATEEADIQGASGNQSLDIVAINLQRFVEHLHRFGKSTVFEVVHTVGDAGHKCTQLATMHQTT